MKINFHICIFKKNQTYLILKTFSFFQINRGDNYRRKPRPVLYKAPNVQKTIEISRRNARQPCVTKQLVFLIFVLFFKRCDFFTNQFFKTRFVCRLPHSPALTRSKSRLKFKVGLTLVFEQNVG
jgi:hypothetical protein